METAAPFDASVLQNLLRRVSKEVRCRRAEHGAWRGAFWGAVLVAAVFAMKGWLGSASLPLVLVAAGLVVAAGAIAGACRRIPALAMARLADRAFDLQDRLTTALECSLQQPAAPLVRALLADAVSRAGEIQRRPKRQRIVQRRLPWEARFLVLPLLAAAALALAPPLQAPRASVDDPAAPGQDKRSPVSFVDRVKHMGRDLLGSQPPAPKDASQQRAGQAPATGEPAQFKDRTIDKRSVDFSSFAKRGDERLRLLERSDQLPDLQSDFATSGYRMLMRKSRELLAGSGPGSAAKLGQILQEMERLGRTGGGEWSDEVNEGLEALQEGLTDEAMSAMQDALGKMRSAEERQRAGKLLKRGPAGDAENEGGDSTGASLAARDNGGQSGYSLSRGGPSKGSPTARLRSTPYDTGVEGMRSGRMPGYETQMRSRAASGAMQLQTAGEIGQYRRLMEDAISREQVPREYRQQIRNYFNSLNEQ